MNSTGRKFKAPRVAVVGMSVFDYLREYRNGEDFPSVKENK